MEWISCPICQSKTRIKIRNKEYFTILSEV
ncbi:cysteine-rich KTR domain-containing protein [Lactobacillus sp. UCMA15818]